MVVEYGFTHHEVLGLISTGSTVYCILEQDALTLQSTIMLLIKLFRIGPVTGRRLAVLDRGRRPRFYTADRGPVTGPIRNNLINEIFIN